MGLVGVADMKGRRTLHHHAGDERLVQEGWLPRWSCSGGDRARNPEGRTAGLSQEFYLQAVEESVLGRTAGWSHKATWALGSYLRRRTFPFCVGWLSITGLRELCFSIYVAGRFLSVWADCMSPQTVCATCLCVLLLGYVSFGFIFTLQDVSFQRGLTVCLHRQYVLLVCVYCC